MGIEVKGLKKGVGNLGNRVKDMKREVEKFGKGLKSRGGSRISSRRWCLFKEFIQGERQSSGKGGERR